MSASKRGEPPALETPEAPQEQNGTTPEVIAGEPSASNPDTGAVIFDFASGEPEGPAPRPLDTADPIPRAAGYDQPEDMPMEPTEEAAPQKGLSVMLRRDVTPHVVGQAHPADIERLPEEPPDVMASERRWREAKPAPQSESERAPEMAPARPVAPSFALACPVPDAGDPEAHLLSCLFVDSERTFDACEGIQPSDFADQNYGAVYKCALALRKEDTPIESSSVAERIIKEKLLTGINVWYYVAQLDSAKSTSLMAAHWAKAVRNGAALRRLERLAADVIAARKVPGADAGALLNEIQLGIDRIQDGNPVRSNAKPFMDFTSPPADDETILLGRFRYICRGGSLIIVAPSSVGKSSAALHMSTCWALGRDWLGIPCKRPLRSLIIQAEDDEGDIGEVRDSVVAGMKLSAAEIATARDRVIVIDERVRVGMALMPQLKALVKAHLPDLVWLNPLLRYAACDITKQAEWAQFFSALSQVNAARSFAYVFIHHTNKPPSTKDKPDRNWNEFMYNMTGSADIVNAVRAVMLFESKKKEGQFQIRLAKRGKRAGVVKHVEADPEKGEGASRTEIVTTIHAQHSSEKLQLKDGRTIPLIFWEPGDAAGDGSESSSEVKRPGRKRKFNFGTFRPSFVGQCPKFDSRKKFGELHKAALGIDGTLARSTFSDLLQDAVGEGLLIQAPDGSGYYLP